MRVLSITRIVMINIIVTVCLFELGLRAQQKIGPLIDLDLRAENIMIGLSDELNHIPVPGEYWDSDGFRTMEEPNSARCARRLLFMGDSFMQAAQKIPGGAVVASLPSDTIPVHVRICGMIIIGIASLSRGMPTAQSWPCGPRRSTSNFFKAWSQARARLCMCIGFLPSCISRRSNFPQWPHATINAGRRII